MGLKPRNSSEANEEIGYFKVPYIGKISESLQIKLDKISVYVNSLRSGFHSHLLKLVSTFPQRSYSERVRFLGCL